MMDKPLILVGGGGHCESVIDVAESAGFRIIGILDLPTEVGKKVFSYEVIGTDDDIPKYVGRASFLVTVGQIKTSSVRVRLTRRIKAVGGKLATVIASTAYVSKYAKIGDGVVIMHNAFVNAGAKIGDSCIVNSFADIEHDVVMGAFCHVSTGAMINGGGIVLNNTFIGSQAVIANNVVIPDNCVIGAGAVVCNTLRESGVYVGNPARLIIIKNDD